MQNGISTSLGLNSKGTFYNGLPKKGALTFKDGKILEGEFIDGLLSGKGIERKDKEIVFKGEFSNGLYHGKGMLNVNDSYKGLKYRGQFKAGRQHGQGKCTWSDGNKYEGEWKEGKKHGRGI